MEQDETVLNGSEEDYKAFSRNTTAEYICTEEIWNKNKIISKLIKNKDL